MNYKNSGVDVDFANSVLNNLKMDFEFSKFFCNKVTNDSILNSNDYCACIDISKLEYQNPILTFSTDGVGSKLILAEKFPEVYSDVTQDLFAMIFNDIICSGSKPLYLLDYYAAHSLKEKVKNLNRFNTILSDLIKLCSEYEIGIIGGETAEIPWIYEKNKFDLAGFGVGVVEKENLITPTKVKYDDVVIGIESSGPHSNGYSLINKIIEVWHDDKLIVHWNEDFIRDCLEPTRIYIKGIMELVRRIKVNGIAHITGGGFNNISRVIPQQLICEIDLGSWKYPTVFKQIQMKSSLTNLEMLETFNCGIGMIVIVSQENANDALDILKNYWRCWEIGKIKYQYNNEKSINYIGEL